jgi:16S rRNA (uracil1498-N3)-methyltransferase
VREDSVMANHRRFFVEPDRIGEREAVIEGAVARQITNVLRLKVGDAIALLDGLGNVYSCEIAAMSAGSVRARILNSESDVNEPRLKLTLASCLPKSDRMEHIVAKCTELGISEIALVQSERTIARPDADNIDKRLSRLRRIATEAAEQCGRSRVPEIRGTLSFAELVAMIARFDLAIVAWEEEDGLSLREALREVSGSHGVSGSERSGNPETPGVRSALIVIGPEGGLTEREVEALKAAGAISVSLGPRLLRTDTAAIAACAAVIYEIEGEL